MSLRLKLLIAVVALVVVGLAVSGVATYTSLRSFLLQRVDQQLVAAEFPVLHELSEPRGGGPSGTASEFPAGTYGEFRDADGTVVRRVTFDYGGTFDAVPDLPATLPRPGAPTTEPDVFTTGSTGATTSIRFRVLVTGLRSQTGSVGTLVVAIPMTEATQTLARLRTIELLVALGVLVALGLVSWWLVRRELRPLEEIGATAGAIAAGSLSQRVPYDDARTEVGRLGIALNEMLARLEESFAERKASEERLRRFLADASHELRTPLTSIRGYAELFRRGASEREEDLEKSMRRIEDESRRMGVMVEDLLLLARLGQGRPLELETVDLAALASDAVDDARAADPQRPIELNAPHPVEVTGDEARLRQVIANLVGNALVHTPPQTPVVVRAHVAGDDAVLEVVDRGPGLTPDQMAHAFEPFYRSDPSRDRATGGAGLGLAIVDVIARAHGGRVEVSETPGGGATFRVTVPRSVPPVVPRADQPATTSTAV